MMHELKASLPLTGTIDNHIQSLGNPVSLKDIARYVGRLKKSEHYTLSSIKTVTFRIRLAFIKGLGRAYTRPRIRAHVDLFFRKLAPKPKNHGVASRLPLTRLEASVLCNTPGNRKYSCLMRFLLLTGCRIHECAKIRLRNIKRQGPASFITIVGKNSRERTFFCGTSLINQIKRYWRSKVFLFEKEKAFGGGQLARQTLAEKVREYSLRLLGRTVAPHDFRKLFATSALQEHPGHIDAIMNFMGISDYNVFRRHYLQNQLDPLKDLKSLRKIAAA